MCGFICVFAVLINKVSLQETVEAVIGGSVLLPCSSTEHDLKLQDINVHWRHNGKFVYDIVKGEDTVSEQDHQYKNRAKTFPEEYERGNFSIKLTDLTHTDAGEYTCFITHSSEQHSDEHHTVQLIINESTAIRSISTEQENQGETEPDSVETSSPWLWVGIASVVIVIGFIVAWTNLIKSAAPQTIRLICAEKRSDSQLLYSPELNVPPLVFYSATTKGPNVTYSRLNDYIYILYPL